MVDAEIDDSVEPLAEVEEHEEPFETPVPPGKPDLPIFSILAKVDFSNHFVIIGDVGTGKSTVTPVHEFELSGKRRRILIREPSRAACNALYYSLSALHPEVKDELAVITKDTQLNVGGKIAMVTDGVLLRMLAEGSVENSSIYFDESHQMTSSLELCMALARKQGATGGNLLRVMSATIDPGEFMRFLLIPKLYTLSGRRFPVKIEVEHARDTDDMLDALGARLRTRRRGHSWLVFLPTRRLVEKFANAYGGVFIHGGLEGSEVNKIQERAERDPDLLVFATNVIASSVNIYLDNVLVFNEAIDGKDRLGQKSLEYGALDNNTLLQMTGRVGRFKPGRAVIISDAHVPKRITPVPVQKDLEKETPFDLVLLMSKYGLELGDLEFMSKVDHREVAFAEGWLAEIGAIDPAGRKITQKGILMSEIPFEPDFSHMVSTALMRDDHQSARFLLACGAFGDSLNHAYRADAEATAARMLYRYDPSNELNIKAHLLKERSMDQDGRFAARLAAGGIFPRFVEEAWKNYEAARGALNDLLAASGREQIPRDVVVDLDYRKLVWYLGDCLTFDSYEPYQAEGLRHVQVAGKFFARTLTVNFKQILYDVVGMDRRGGWSRGADRNHGWGRRG